MQRKTAVAAAGAISMSLLSMAVAVGANFGALGFGSTPSATAAQPTAVTAAPAATATKASATAKHDEESAGTAGTTYETHQKERGSDD